MGDGLRIVEVDSATRRACAEVADHASMQIATTAVGSYLHFLAQRELCASPVPAFGPVEYVKYLQGQDTFDGLRRFLKDTGVLDYDKAPTYEEPNAQETVLAVARSIPIKRTTADGIALQFDQDGVLTRTPHEECWKVVFDKVLTKHGLPEFTSEDYHTVISGRNRFEAIYDYLVRKGILEDTAPDRLPATLSQIPLVYDIADEKNRLVRSRLKGEPVVRIEPTISLLSEGHDRWGLPTAVVSASKSTNLALSRAGITGLVDVVLEGRMTEIMGWTGKPAPDLYACGARLLGVRPEQTVVVEDAPKGMLAATAAHVGLRIGYADPAICEEMGRFGADLRKQLEEAGAHVVVSSLAEITPREIMRRLGV